MESEKPRTSYTVQALVVMLEKQEQLMREIEKEIYENISQILCLALLQLSSLETGNPGKTEEQVKESAILIAQAIRDLRNLGKKVKEAEGRISTTG